MAFYRRPVTMLVLVAITAWMCPMNEAAAHFSTHKVDPDHPGMCTISGEDNMENGETRQNLGCSSTRCKVKGEEFFLETYGCDLLFADPPCWAESDATKDHPYCCPRKVCPGDEE